MAPQDKLVEVGLDGFALLDEVYGRNKKSAGSRVPATTTTIQAYDRYNHDDHYHKYKNPQQYVYRGVKVTTARVINSNQAAQIYGGMLSVDYSIRKPVLRAQND